MLYSLSFLRLSVLEWIQKTRSLMKTSRLSSKRPQMDLRTLLPRNPRILPKLQSPLTRYDFYDVSFKFFDAQRLSRSPSSPKRFLWTLTMVCLVSHLKVLLETHISFNRGSRFLHAGTSTALFISAGNIN